MAEVEEGVELKHTQHKHLHWSELCSFGLWRELVQAGVFIFYL
jgi:hypothetical protein